MKITRPFKNKFKEKPNAIKKCLDESSFSSDNSEISIECHNYFIKEVSSSSDYSSVSEDKESQVKDSIQVMNKDFDDVEIKEQELIDEIGDRVFEKKGKKSYAQTKAEISQKNMSKFSNYK